MKQPTLVLVIALAAGGVPVLAQEAQQAPAEEPTPEKKICRTQKVTGSLTRRSRICMTESQWRELSARTRQGVGDLQNSGSGAPSCVSVHDTACGTAPGPGGAMPSPTGSGLNS